MLGRTPERRLLECPPSNRAPSGQSPVAANNQTGSVTIYGKKDEKQVKTFNSQNTI